MKDKPFRFCYNWKSQVKEVCQIKEDADAINYTKLKDSKTREKRAISNRCIGQGNFYINSRNDLEVLCDFSSCYGGDIISNIIWERDGNLRHSWHTLYNDPDRRITRLGRYKSLLEIRNYRPYQDDGRYRCYAQMRFYHGSYNNCNRNHLFRWLFGCRYRNNVQTVFGNIDVFGRPYRQNSNFLYDNIGYTYSNYRNRYRDQRYRDEDIRQISFG